MHRAAPGQVTDVALQEGEQLVGSGPRCRRCNDEIPHAIIPCCKRVGKRFVEMVDHFLDARNIFCSDDRCLPATLIPDDATQLKPKFGQARISDH